MNNNKTESIAVRVKPQLKEQLIMVAATKDKKLSEFIREVLEDYLAFGDYDEKL